MAASLASAIGLQGAVTSWDFAKSIGGVLEADNTEPGITFFDIESCVVTESAGDATSVTISGGGIQGSLAFTLEGEEWCLEKDYNSEAEMDAEFPNDTQYTITLSGGTLGTLTQTFTVGAKAYSSLPYLVGDGYSTLQNFDPSSEFTFQFASPSGAPNFTAVEIEADGDSPFDAFVDGSQTSLAMNAGTLSEGQLYEGYLDHINGGFVSGTGGFGAEGTVAQLAFTQFSVDTRAANSIIGGWTFGDSESDGSGVVVFMKDGTFYLVEDTEDGSSDPDGYERGTYTWNAGTGAFTASVLADGNGQAGLSHPAGNTSVEVNGSALTYTDSEGSTVLTRVEGAGSPIVGAWQFGEGRAIDSRILVFLPSGIYFEAQEFGVETGMEKGRYVWDPTTGVFEATVLLDTNAILAFSNELDGFKIHIQADEMLIFDDDQESRLYLVDPTTEGRPIPQVTRWKFVKGREHFQNKNNTAPVPMSWSVSIDVETKMNLDAMDMEIRGGGIPGAYPLIHISGREWAFNKDYSSEAAMNAEFPAGAEFTIELSGGNLGTMSQSFTLMADRYPNTPYLTGTSFTAAQSFDSFNDFTLNWSDPGSLTAANGQTILEVFMFYDRDSVSRDSKVGATTQGVVPARTVWPGHTFYGYLEYTNARSIDGSTGFGVDGTESRNAAVDFTLGAFTSPLADAWSFGDASDDGSGVLVFLNNGTFFYIEDAVESDPNPDGYGRGEYSWDRNSGAFEFEVKRDTNGALGLSSMDTLHSLSISGDTLTLTSDGGSRTMTKVTSSSEPLVGGWQWGEGGAEYGNIYVFLDNGYYFGLVYEDFAGLALDAGIEKGTYSFFEVDLVPVLEANAVLDTNGERGLSHVEGEWSADLMNDRFSFFDNRGGEFLTNVEVADVQNRMRFFDASFESAIRLATGKTNGHIVRLDMQRILKLDASGRGITELENLSEAYNLRELDLSNNAIEDIWSVGDLRELRVLDLSSNRISDISDLSRLTKLVELDLSSNLLSDPGTTSTGPTEGIQVFSEFKPLESTGVLGVLDGIESLEVLRFANNEIRDLNVLTTLPSVRRLDLSGNQVNDITVLSQLPLLEKLAIYGNPVDLSEGSSQLKTLNAVIANTGADVLLEAPDPFGNYLVWVWDEVSQRYQLVWTEAGVLQGSTDLNTWVNLEGAVSPYALESDEENPRFWRLNVSF